MRKHEKSCSNNDNGRSKHPQVCLQLPRSGFGLNELLGPTDGTREYEHQIRCDPNRKAKAYPIGVKRCHGRLKLANPRAKCCANHGRPDMWVSHARKAGVEEAQGASMIYPVWPFSSKDAVQFVDGMQIDQSGEECGKCCQRDYKLHGVGPNA